MKYNQFDYIFPIIKLLQDGKKHTEAFSKLSQDYKVAYSTVSYQCTRHLGISTEDFVSLVRQNKIEDFLINKFPHKKRLITENLNFKSPILQPVNSILINTNIMSNKIIIRPASLVKQGGLILYATSLKVSDLLIPNFYSVETLDPADDSDKGYQRLLNKARAKKLADYIVTGQDTQDAFLPTSIFIATHKDIAFNPSTNTIEINIDEIGPFSVVDGQHRVEGLKMAAEIDSRVLDFEVPVNIAINLSKIAQMCHFLIVNTTQKSVEKGVEQRIYARLTKALEVEDIPSLPKWILNSIRKGEDEKALQFVDFLNSDKESPWFNKIEMANEENRDASVNQKSFVKAIKKYILVANNPITIYPDAKQHKIFLNYWVAITNIIGREEPTVLFKYNGVELFCKFCVPFFNKLINLGDFKVSAMESLLNQTFENVDGDDATGVGHAEFWIKGSTASGLNSGALSKINNEMVKALHKSNLQKDIEI